MPWPEEVLRQLQQIPVNPTEAEFHGPYNKLLNVPFPTRHRFYGGSTVLVELTRVRVSGLRFHV